MMKQTSPLLAICFRLLMTAIGILSDISVMLIHWMWYTASCHCPGDERSGMASSFTGWGGCPLVQTSWRWDGSSLLHCMDNPQESLWLKLGTICIPTNRRNYCISWPIMSVPSTDMNIYLHIQTGSFKYPHLKILLGNEGSDNLSCIDSVLLGWMDVISCWCRAKARRPTIAVTKKT